MKWMLKIMALALLSASIMTACENTSAQIKTTPQQEQQRNARAIRGASPYEDNLKNEPAPKLIVDPPLPDLLAQGVVWIQWRVENVHIAPIFGNAAKDVSPRLGHLHVQVDDLPWWWADPSNINTIDMAGLPPGPHKVKVTLVDPSHQPFPGQTRIISFTIPKGAKTMHSH